LNGKNWMPACAGMTNKVTGFTRERGPSPALRATSPEGRRKIKGVVPAFAEDVS
jgi:hypothetical protein